MEEGERKLWPLVVNGSVWCWSMSWHGHVCSLLSCVSVGGMRLEYTHTELTVHSLHFSLEFSSLLTFQQLQVNSADPTCFPESCQQPRFYTFIFPSSALAIYIPLIIHIYMKNPGFDQVQASQSSLSDTCPGFIHFTSLLKFVFIPDALTQHPVRVQSHHRGLQTH